MASFLDLPEEILIIILRLLDTQSVYNLCKTCGKMKNIIILRGVIRVCNLSCSTLSISKSLQLDMIKLISGHLYELNLSGVSNLKKSLLLTVLKRMTSLRTLNVSYTDITLRDMVELYKICTTIKDLSIDIHSQFTFIEESHIDGFTWKDECQKMFKNLTNLHFVTNKMNVNVLMRFLRICSLNTLKFTLFDLREQDMYNNMGSMILPCKHLSLFMMDYGPINMCQGSWQNILPSIDMEDIEFIILQHNDSLSICTSSLFTNFFSKNFNITSFVSFDRDKNMYGAVGIFIWNKKTTIFDELFFLNLKKRIKEILPCELNISSKQTLQSGIDTQCYDLFHINPLIGVCETKKTNTESDYKRRRIVQSDEILDYDNLFSKHKKIKLHICISSSVNVILSSRYEYLRKLTYLSLVGPFVRYSNDFLNILFRCCTNLITLNIEASKFFTCYSSVVRCIPLSQSLKNLRIVDRSIDFKTLFSHITQCKTLENIWIHDNSTDYNEIADLAILYQCVNLYNLHIKAYMKKCSFKKIINMYKTLQNRESDHYINFVLVNSISYTSVFYTPYMDVFNIRPIKPI